MSQSDTKFNNQEEALEKFNEHLAKLFLKQRWNTLEEIKVSKIFNWKQVITSVEFLKIGLLILIANLMFKFVPFLTSSTVFLIVTVYYALLHGFLFIKNYNEKQPQKGAFIQSLIKEIGMFLAFILGFERMYFNIIPIPDNIKTLCFYFNIFLITTQVTVFSELNLVYQLATKIQIEGQDWKLTRLAMMNKKAVELFDFYTRTYQDTLKLKKNK